MGYPGSKSGNGSFQQIISEIPLSTLFVEGFTGSGVVWENMRLCERSILIDIDPRVCESLIAASKKRQADTSTAVLCGSFLDYLEALRGEFESYKDRCTIYLDPPYPFSVRKSGQKGIYKHEFGGTAQHADLLSRVYRLPCNVLISGYSSPLYDQWLSEWRVKRWQVMTRGGPAIEKLWMNFPPAAVLQDGRYIGENYTQRQRLRRLAGVERR